MSERAIILAPRGRDAALAQTMLAEAGLTSRPVSALPELIAELETGAGFAVVTEEALVRADAAPLLAWREAQPEWSDLPFILLTERGGVERNPAAARYLELLGNVTFVERPFHPTTFVSLARAALRGRRKQYEARARLEALHRSDERFRAAIDAVQGVLWTNSADGRMEGEQPGWGALTGQSFDAYQGYGWADAVHPDDAQPTVDSWQDALSRQGLFAFEHRVRRHDGEWRTFSIRAIPTFSTDGSLREWVGVHTDVTARRRAEDALRDLNTDLEARVAERTRALQASETRLRTQFETSFALQSLVDLKGRVIDVNRTALDALGDAPRETVVGKLLWRTPWFSATPGMEAQVEAAFAEARAGTTVRIEVQLNLPVGGWRWFDFVLRPMRDAAGAIIAVVPEAVETTARRLAEDALRQSQKMEAIGQLTGGVAHDFNNLLTVIRSSSDLLRRPGLTDERRVRYLDAIAQTSDRAAKLTHQLLTFSRRQALRPEVFDVGERLGAIATMLQTVVGSRVALSIGAAPDLLVKADAPQFETAIVNLCVNARDAMNGEGTLSIDAHAIVAEDDSHCVEIAVRDTGVGIAPDVLPRLFEPFFTTKQIGKGTGLGLSQVYGFATQAGGRIHAISEPGEGAIFTLVLPVTGETTAPAPPSHHLIRPPRGGRILVVEDNDEIRSFAVQLLSDMGYHITDAGSADEALRKLDTAEPPFDLVFTDVVMPGASGIDLAKTVRARMPALPIVLTSGYSDALANAEGSEFPLLPKPYSSQQLIEAIETTLQ